MHILVCRIWVYPQRNCCLSNRGDQCFP